MGRKLFYSTLVLAFVLAGIATADVTTNPGYADLESLELIFGTPAQEQDLGSTQLAEILGQDATPEMLNLVEGIELVQVRVFELGDDQKETIRRHLGAAAEDLRNGGWNTLVSVTDKDDQVNLLVRMQGDDVVGLVALVGDGGKAILANVVGDLDPGRLMPLMGNASAAQSLFGRMGATVSTE
jgi:Domain of unknown function (DUF4252)